MNILLWVAFTLTLIAFCVAGSVYFYMRRRKKKMLLQQALAEGKIQMKDLEEEAEEDNTDGDSPDKQFGKRDRRAVVLGEFRSTYAQAQQ